MKITSFVRTVKKKPSAPFPQSGNRFDQLFKDPQRRKKAWDGQDKDAFFRDKYAHVHAKQLKRRKEEQHAKNQRNGKSRRLVKEEINEIKPEFAAEMRSRLMKNKDLEYVYGKNAVNCVLQNRKVEKIFTGFSSVDEIDSDLLALARNLKVPVLTKTPLQHLEIMSNFGVHNKYVAETRKLKLPIANSISVDTNELCVFGEDEIRIPILNESRNFKKPLGLYIDQVTDTHNMGALLRSALWFGIDFVAFSGRNCAPLSSAVVKSSSGASEFIPILETPHPLRFFDSLKNNDWNILASAPNDTQLKKHNIELETVATQDLISLGTKPTLLVVGSEGDGIRTNILSRSTHKTKIETNQNHIDSLNVSVATAVLLSSLCK